MQRSRPFISTCTDKRLIGLDLYELRFSKSDDFTYQSGQFVLFDVPAVGASDDIQTRAYSIASHRDEKELLFLIKLKENGRASLWIRDVLAPGTDVRMQGPLGLFTISHDNENDSIFIATGTGLAPFRAMIPEVLDRAPMLRTTLFFAVRTEDDFFWHAEIDAWKRRGNFSFFPIISAPTTSWSGLTGRVQEIVPRVMDQALVSSRFYVCGNPAMTKDVRKLAIEEWRVPKEQVHAEGYI